jgi:hypothetical protein
MNTEFLFMGFALNALSLLGWMLAACFALMVVYGRMARNGLNRIIAKKDEKIAELRGEALELADKLRAYKATWEALAPKDDEIHLTRIVRKEPSLNEQIIKIIRDAGGI